MPKARFTVTLDTTCEFDLEYDGSPGGFVEAQRRVYGLAPEEMIGLAAGQGRETHYNVWAVAVRLGGKT